MKINVDTVGGWADKGINTEGKEKTMAKILIYKECECGSQHVEAAYDERDRLRYYCARCEKDRTKDAEKEI